MACPHVLDAWDDTTGAFQYGFDPASNAIEDRIARQLFHPQITTVRSNYGEGDDALRRILSALQDSRVELEAAANYVPDPNAGTFEQHVREAAHALKNGATQIAAVELGGWDTHAAQTLPASDPDFFDQGQPALLKRIDEALAWANIFLADPTGGCPHLILFISEFGRTIYENASGGTDHGLGGLCIALGSNVRSAVYNCRPNSSAVTGTSRGATWTSLGAMLQSNDWLSVATHFTAVYARILRSHFGIQNNAIIQQILPDWQPSSTGGAIFDEPDFIF